MKTRKLSETLKAVGEVLIAAGTLIWAVHSLCKVMLSGDKSE